MNISLEDIKRGIRHIDDFPKPGIGFKDITTLLKEPELFGAVVQMMEEKYRDKGITKVVGIESRGFVAGGVIARDLNAGFIVARKPGKLPAETIQVAYDLEYGQDIIEIHKDALNEDDVVLLHDDLLATGGTMEAAIKLVKQFGIKKIYVNFIVELTFLKGVEKLQEATEVYSLVKY